MKFAPRALSLSLLLATGLAWSQVPLDKERAANIVNQVLTERGIALQSTDDGGTQFKSQPFKFDSESQVHYQGRYDFSVINGDIKVTVTDVKFASGLPSLFPVSSSVLAGLIGPVQERLQALVTGVPSASGGSIHVVGKSATAGGGPTFNANGEPLMSSPDGLIPGRKPGERAPSVIPATGEQLNQADILGLNLDMSAAQARKVLIDKAKWTERPLKTSVDTAYRQQLYTVGNFLYRCAGVGACKLRNAVEAVTTYALPDEPNLMGIHRVRVFGEKEKPLLNETIKALQQKYGREMFHTPYEKLSYSQTYVMRWVTNIPGGVSGDFNGLSPVDQKSAMGCPMSFMPEAPIPVWGDPTVFYSGHDIDLNMPLTNGSKFFEDVNRMLRKEHPQTGCGTLLGVVLTLDNNRDYVSRMETGVLNYARMNAQLLTLSNALIRESDSVRTQKLGEDKARQPEL